MSGHTPTPWVQDRVKDATYSHVSSVPGYGGDIATAWVNGEANGAFIVKAVNSHDALVKKLEEIHDITQDTTLGVECWQKLQNIAATAAAALASIKERA